MKKLKLSFPTTITFLLGIIFFVFLIGSLDAAKATQFPELNYPPVIGAQAPQDFLKTAAPEEIPPLYIKYIFHLAVSLGGVIAFVFLIIGGARYLFSLGNPAALKAAQEQMMAAFLGILILLSSWLIFKIINPQLLVFELEELPEIKITQRATLPAPGQELISSIDAEMPLGRIIEGGIFGKELMAAVKANAAASAELASQLKEQGEQLNSAVQGCSCSQPKPRCTPCVSGQTCTSDPCNSVRGKIQEIEKNNIEKIEKLKIEEQKTAQEAKILKTEVAKLERLESFLTESCRLWTLKSLNEFLIKVDEFQKQGPLRQIRFWDDVNNVYYSEQERKTIRDWAAFYCPVSGTTFLKQPSTPALEEPDQEIPEEFTETIKSCTNEVPLGEIFDRTKRTAKLLIARLETLINFDRRIVQAVDQLQVAASQCTSQRCTSICVKTKTKCIKSCQGTPCPFGDIAAKAQAIAEIQAAIKKLTEEEKKEEMGILPLVNQVVSGILDDLKSEVRLTMGQCVSKGGDKTLYECQRTIGALDQKGTVIKTCCNKEPVFQECLNSCYLEKNQDDYKKCLGTCLNKKAADYNKEEIGWCRHQLNFFCCSVEKEPLK